MHIRIRKLAEKAEDLIVEVKKSAFIKDLQNEIFKRTKIKISNQKLYYKGKQLMSENRLLDYEIQYNDVIQLLTLNEYKNEENLEIIKKESLEEKRIITKSSYYEIGDKVDAKDSTNGAWFEGKIKEIYTNTHMDETSKNSSGLEEENLIFKIQMERSGELEEFLFNDIRPVSYHTYKLSEIKTGMVVLANYNIDEPKSRGLWYDTKITKCTSRSIKGTVLLNGNSSINDCSIKFTKEIMRIEKPNKDKNYQTKKNPLRKLPPFCSECNDIPSKQCNECSCQVCLKKNNIKTLILCDECDLPYHLACLTPPLTGIPPGYWYCPECKLDENEIIKPGEQVRISDKKKKMPSYKQNKPGNSNWGKGMACVGRTKECNIVSKNHYGPIPGIDVGTCWKFRIQVYEAGVHRHHVAGIHGRENDGAYSLILSGGYEDDIDNGDEFYYTGSGGRDLSGNKRIANQSCDQQLTRMNRALALNCNIKLNEEIGGESTDWKSGKPVRVVRNYKLKKHSKYAPKEGNRYDGIYKVVKYFPQKGKSGYIVWRYLLRRDDPIPAPWTKDGKEYEMIYPSGYLEANRILKENNKNKTKRKQTDLKDFCQVSQIKKSKLEEYEISSDILELITLDKINCKLWDECKLVCKQGKQKFLNKVEESFTCVCCQDLLKLPITTNCKHNICKICLEQSFAAEIYTCPYCRTELGIDYKINVNNNLMGILKLFFQ